VHPAGPGDVVPSAPPISRNRPGVEDASADGGQSPENRADSSGQGRFFGYRPVAPMAPAIQRTVDITATPAGRPSSANAPGARRRDCSRETEHRRDVQPRLHGIAGATQAENNVALGLTGARLAAALREIAIESNRCSAHLQRVERSAGTRMMFERNRTAALLAQAACLPPGTSS